MTDGGKQTQDAATRRSEASWALITRRDGPEDRWLARWNAHWARYNFVGGHRHDGESYRDCLVREIVEELGLMERRDYTICQPAPFAHMTYNAWSMSAARDTSYEIEVFGVSLADTTARFTTQRPVRWLARAEIESLQCANGKPVSGTMRRVLESMNWRTVPQGVPTAGQ
jgi:ferredoxin-NADP reductase